MRLPTRIFARPVGRVARGTAVTGLVAILAGFAPTLAAAADANGLTLSDGYMRTIIPSRPAAGYFTLKNTGTADRTLVGAASPACGTLMLHQSVSENGVDKMIHVDSIPLPAGKSVVFAPGGFHLMCMSPGPAIKAGGQVPVTLTFKDGTALTRTFPVRGPGSR